MSGRSWNRSASEWLLSSGAASLLVSTTVLSASCGPGLQRSAGTVVIDGSSTVYPLVEALAEEFHRQDRQRRVTVAVSGSSGGFRRFCDGEVDVTSASRPISPAEADRCRANGIEPLSFALARDGLTVVANPDNSFLDCLSLAELREIWEASSRVVLWRDLRPHFPAEAVRLFGPGVESGTLDYFNTVVIGRPRGSRPDYYQTEDDFLVVQGVAGHPTALGYFGHGYYVANRDRLKAIAIDAGFGCVSPTAETISDGSYAPLTRELYLYVGANALGRDVVRRFVSFALSRSGELAPTVGYVSLPAAEYRREQQRLEAVRAAPA